MGHIQGKIDIDTKIDRLTTELAALTGEDGKVALLHALEERVEKLRADQKATGTTLAADDIEERRKTVDDILAKFARMPVLDHRSPDEIVGYNDIGAFD